MDADGADRMTAGDGEADSTAECFRAAGLAAGFLASRDRNPEDYKLVEARNVLEEAGSTGPGLWRFTFKSRDLIPDSPRGRVGKGGEVLVEVDLSTGTTRLVGYGE